jgi:3-oxoacyl-[acyl-carrier-protein] synthase II
MRRVVVTGIGSISSVGHSSKEVFDNLINGVCGIDKISLFDTTDYSIKIAGEVKDFDPTLVLPAKEVKKADRFIQLGLHACKEAFEDCGISADIYDMDRFGVSAGSGVGGLPAITNNSIICNTKGPRRVSPFFIPSSLINMLGGLVSITHSLKGPNLASATACAAGTHAISEAYKTIALGGADAMLAVGAESTICSTGVSGFANMKALSTIEDPKKASRPFDKDRAGFVIGEGAGALVLEEYESAKKRGAKIYSEIVGFGESSDAHHITTPSPNGAGANRAMRAALSMAKVNKVDYINAHGTSTKFNDWYESCAIADIFGSDVPPVSSIKGNIGHCLGAAGAIEAVVLNKVLQDNVIPPTINYDTPDEDCPLDYVPNTARDMKVDVVMSNSFGFGGTNGVLVFKRI